MRIGEFFIQETEAGGVEHEAGAVGAIKAVSQDGVVKSQGMGTVDAQLVSTARQRAKF